MSSLTGFLLGVSSSITASFIISIFAYLRYFKNLSEKTLSQINKIVNPVDPFNDLKGFVDLLNETIDSYKEEYSRLVLYRALPCELTDGLVQHIYSNEKEQPEGLKKSIITYNTLINKIVKEGIGSFDETVFGKTDIDILNTATFNTIQSHYFGGVNPPDTTELGLHENLNEIGVILFGITESSYQSDLVVFVAGFLITFSRDFKSLKGFRHNVHSHIHNLFQIFEQRKVDSTNDNLYYVLSSKMNKNQYEDMIEQTKSFYSK